MGSRVLVVFALLALAGTPVRSQAISIDWDQVQRVSVSTPTLQVVSNPLLVPGAAPHDSAFAELARLGADHVRYVPWFPYPALGVPEPKAPANGKTSWDFTGADPLVLDLMRAQAGRSVIMNFSTIPAWIVADTSYKTLGDYYARILEWYEKGGFTDEMGVVHTSGHHFKFEYWEAFNEPDLEGKLPAQEYCKRYDALVSAMRKVDPALKFGGPALAGSNEGYIRYFLDPKNHLPGIPIDLITLHSYLNANATTFTSQSDHLIEWMYRIRALRDRFRPSAVVDMDELGLFLPGHAGPSISDPYWNMAGAHFAYVFGQACMAGVELMGMSQLMAQPGNFPDVSMLDWTSGKANARSRVLELLIRNLHPGDTLVATHASGPSVFALGFIDKQGEHKLLLVNEDSNRVSVNLPQKMIRGEGVDRLTGPAPVGVLGPTSGLALDLQGYAVVVATLEKPAVRVSPHAGTYAISPARPLRVSLTADAPGAPIHYTVDGSTPTAASATYTGPLLLTSAATVKAIREGSDEPVTAVYGSGAPQFLDGSFEAPKLPAKAFAYRIDGAAWDFFSTAGLAANGSLFTNSNPASPDGSQSLLLQSFGVARQFLPLEASTYALTGMAAQRGSGQNGGQTFAIRIDGKGIGEFTPSAAGYAPFATAAFAVSGGVHRVELEGLNPLLGDNTVLIDNLALVQKSVSRLRPDPFRTGNPMAGAYLFEVAGDLFVLPPGLLQAPLRASVFDLSGKCLGSARRSGDGAALDVSRARAGVTGVLLLRIRTRGPR